MSRQLPLRVTGYSLCTPLGVERDAVISQLRDGRSGLTPPPFDLPFDTVVGRVRAPLGELPQRLAAWDTRPARMAATLAASLEPALFRARQRWPAGRMGILLGTSTAGAEATESAYRYFVEHGQLPEHYDFSKQHTYGAVLHVVRELTGFTGPAWMISTTCTSSAKPLASALRLVQCGVLDAALVGGIDTLCAMTLTGFHSLGALSPSPCRPFSEVRDGINIGEGGAFLLLERAGEARALLEAVGESSDAYHISAPHPEGAGAQSAMERALQAASVQASEVDHINAHGTATPLNDIAESKAIKRVFGDQVPVTSTKSYTGHALGGAGATEAALSILALEEGFVPATLGADPLDPRIAIHVVRQRLDLKLGRVMSNSFAFGGNNVCVLLRSA